MLVLRPEGDPLRRYASTPGATTQPLEANGNRLGQLVRLPDGRAYVYLAQPAEAGRIYQMWQIQGGVPVSLGLFEGQGFLLTGLATGATVAVSVEPPAAARNPPRRQFWSRRFESSGSRVPGLWGVERNAFSVNLI